LDSMSIIAKTSEVLATLRTNREDHARIVKEARIGYVERAQVEVTKRLAQLKEGQIVSLSFDLRVPLDYTKVYDTAIKMLELHQQDTIQLEAVHVRNLMQDQWDWTDAFYGTNSVYSKSASDKIGASP